LIFPIQFNRILQVATLALALVAPWAQAADAVAPVGQRVFVCAHSFMLFTAKLLPPMADAAGIAHVNAGQQMIGGSRVIQHWNLPDAKNGAKTALREGKVDVLTLSPHTLLPDPGIDQFTQLGIEQNPALRVLVQASWPTYDGTSKKGFANPTRDAATVASLRTQRDAHNSGWLVNLEAQIRTLNATIGRPAVFLVPVSNAVFALRERIAEGRAPGLTRQTELFSDDLGHPRPPLAVLVTYCHFAAIYGRSPVGLTVPAALKENPEAEALNRLLQQLAWAAVTDHPLSGVRPPPSNP
jgi:hypothetical protein